MTTRTLRFAVCAVVALGGTALPASAAADYPHVVQPGETLTWVAAVDGISIQALAAANGISPNAELIAGQVLLIPPRTPVPTTTTPAPTTTTTGPTAVPQPTAERVSATEIAEIADSVGVPAALAQAVAWQESGWNNGVVSDVGAVGVMQIVPSTWRWINQYLTPADPLATDSAAENIRAGALLLHTLIEQAGGSYALAIAGYYQGLGSIRKHGIYSDTQHYVNDVLALYDRFGG